MQKEVIKASECLECGDAAQAEILCLHLLDDTPECADAWHLLGVARLQQGRPNEAPRCLRRAIAADDGNPVYRNTLGVTLASLQEIDEAIAEFRNAVALDPHFADAHYNLAKALKASGNLDEAVESFRKAMGLQPENPAIHFDLANALRAMKRSAEAAASYHEALRLKPDYMKAYTNLGRMLSDARRFGDAEACFRQAVLHRPDYYPGHVNLGELAMRQKAFVEAERHYRMATALDGNAIEARVGLARSLLEQDKLDDAAAVLDASTAETAYSSERLLESWLRLADKLRAAKRHPEAEAIARRVLAIRPGFARALENLGLVLAAQGRLEESVATYRHALEFRPDMATLHNNLAVALQTLGEDEMALGHLDAALRLRPDMPVARVNRAVLRLREGDFAAGWPEYEWRRFSPGRRSRSYGQPLWLGQTSSENILLLHGEQGLGDTIQFVRYAKLAKQRVGTVLVECQRPLIRLLSRCPWIDHVIPWGAKLPEHDYQAPLASLPLILDTRVDQVPAEVPYIRADETLVAAWRDRLAEFSEMKVGIAWQGSPKYTGDAYRSLPLGHLAPLADVEGVRLFSLQKGHGASQLAELGERLPVIDFGPDLDTTAGAFMDTAAIVENLDLVICSDSAIAHLAGAMGRPVWILLTTCSDWRWLKGREDNPWYPTMRLFRQKRLGDWDNVATRVADELRRLVAGDTERLRPVDGGHLASISSARSPAPKRDDTARPTPPARDGIAAGTALCAPTSPGDLLDRMSILRIKLDRIADEEKRSRVRDEFARLDAVQHHSIVPSADLARLTGELDDVNRRLWEIEDELRGCEAARDFGARFVELARSVYQTNDRRAAIKNQINTLSNSPIVEQKQHPSYGSGGETPSPRKPSEPGPGGRSVDEGPIAPLGQVLYINLARRPDRNQRFLDCNAGCAQFTRMDAVDGRGLDVPALIRLGVLREPLSAYTAGAIGLALSHRRAWEQAATAGQPLAVAEDDAVLNRHFAETATGLLNRLPPDWDIVLWGWNFDSILHVEVIPGIRETVMHFDPRCLGSRTADFQRARHDVIAMRLFGAFGTVCYSVSPKGARRLGSLCFPLIAENIPIAGLRRAIPNTGIDTVMNKHYRQLKAYTCLPPLAWTENDHSTSDVHR